MIGVLRRRDLCGGLANDRVEGDALAEVPKDIRCTHRELTLVGLVLANGLAAGHLANSWR